ncbi:N-acetylglucosamine kinase [Homoserinibacter sp. YIM 151385]|uniref:N-acetylglucosamine kinase n=1 Tax=Homoserinibacter sp. YIM 151385 TaxID=2985506 RepID=UPI0022F0F6CC|nr:BadF/BadG/BcrA/BcrD ATPase family protein [Homoserinibacter sp. YIM 151385]WBU39408.1 hypothetical protein OF852_11835 [Homoserinibacter sp. YIM 151385]
MDAGQTAVKARVASGDGTRADLLLPPVRTNRPLLGQLAEAAREASRRTGGRIDVLALGVSGLTEEEADAERLLELVAELGVRRILLAHDATTSYLGALGDRVGVVVAAGTGAVTLGVGRTRSVRVDGWGHLIGDAGSGYWIGRRALDAAMRAHDGRAEPTALLGLLRARWPDPEAAYIDLQSDPDRVRRIAALAEEVAGLAGSDAAAERVCIEAARELSSSALAAARQIDHGDGGIAVAAIGSIFRSDVIAAHFAATLSHARRDVELVDALGDGLDGAGLLIGLPEGHALRGEVREARRSMARSA